MPPSPDRILSLDYIAGFCDGEGCIALRPAPRAQDKYGWYARVVIVQKRPEVLRQMQSQFGGNVYRRDDQAMYWWQLNGDAAISFVELLEPHLVVKQEEARALLHSYSLPSHEREEYAQILKDLKKNAS